MKYIPPSPSSKSECRLELLPLVDLKNPFAAFRGTYDFLELKLTPLTGRGCLILAPLVTVRTGLSAAKTACSMATDVSLLSGLAVKAMLESGVAVPSLSQIRAGTAGMGGAAKESSGSEERGLVLVLLAHQVLRELW